MRSSRMRTRGRKQADDAAAAASTATTNSVDGESSDGNAARVAKRSSSPPPLSSYAVPATTSSTSSTTVVKVAKVESPTHTPSASSSPPSRIPRPLQFPLVVVLSLALSTLGYSLAYPYTMSTMAAHERPLETWSEAALVVGWRIAELGLGWFGNYDGYDLAAINILSHGPPLYLLYAFYEAPAPALLLSLAIETLGTYLPFRLLRPLSTAHAAPSRAPNAEIVGDRPIALLTTLMAGAIYSVTLFLAYATYLPTYLVMYFHGLPSLTAAHESTWVGTLPAALALGFAAHVFVFAPAGAAPVNEARRRTIDGFDPATAGLAETVRWNLWWGWRDHTRAVVGRTLLLITVTAANAFLHARLAVRGVETPGAVAWASVWALASAFTGLGLGIVGSV